MPELTASEITKDAILMLRARNCKAWRQNNLTVRRRKGIVTKGVTDIIGFNKGTGVAIFAEVKKIGDVISNDQIIFLGEAKQAGCLTLIATEVKGKTVLIDFSEYHKD